MSNKRNVTISSIVLLIYICLTIAAQAAVPPLINYQGQLTDEYGVTVPDATYSITFSVYSSDAGGSPEWTETKDVATSNGLYHVLLGSVTPFNGFYITDPLYLGITVSPDSEMTPRQRLTSSPFSMRAALADTIADGVVKTVNLEDNAVTGAKIDDGTVEASDLSDGLILEEITANDGTGSGLDSDMLDGHDTAYFATAATVTTLQNQVAGLQSQVNTLVTLLAGVTRADSDIHFDGVNVHIRDGSGATASSTPNGLGNLIVGYNENRPTGSAKTGSHNIIVGPNHNYTSYGGLVAGYANTVSGSYSSVSGGRNNIASGEYAFVGGGGGEAVTDGNQAFSHYSSVLGGFKNIAGDPLLTNHLLGTRSAISGGLENKASGEGSSVSGGWRNTASGPEAVVAGGFQNDAQGNRASVTGGGYNVASGSDSAVSGGRYNLASGARAFVGGGGGLTANDGNEAFADYSAILGGTINVTGDNTGSNHTIGTQSTVSGGSNNTASGDYSSVSGGGDNMAEGRRTSVSGGRYNAAIGGYAFVGGGGGSTAADGNRAFSSFSSVLGGFKNIAGDPALIDHLVGQHSTISGGLENKASGEGSSVVGGWRNTASGPEASVTGGFENDAQGNRSSVTGGENNLASGSGSAISGGRYGIASGDYSFIGGGGSAYPSQDHQSFSHYSAILGGRGNFIGDKTFIDHEIGEFATISGGISNWASGYGSIVSGGVNNTASAPNASVGGGQGNTASGWQASVSGGHHNTAEGNSSSVSGGRDNTANGDYSSVSGGSSNTAGGNSTSVSGGSSNTANNYYSSVSGGYNGSVIGIYDWRVGDLFQDD